MEEKALTMIAGATIEEPAEPTEMMEIDENEQKIQMAIDAVKEACALGPEACRRILEAMRIPSIFVQSIVTDPGSAERIAAELTPKMPELPMLSDSDEFEFGDEEAEEQA